MGDPFDKSDGDVGTMVTIMPTSIRRISRYGVIARDDACCLTLH